MMERLNKVFWYLVAYLLVYLVGLKIFPTVFGSLAIAFLFTVIIDVIAGFFQKLKIKRKLSILFATLLFYGILVYSIYSVFPITIQESKKIFSNSIELPSGTLGKIAQNIINYVNDNLQSIVLNILSYIASNATKILTMALLLAVASAYFNVIKKKMIASLYKFFPNSSIDEARKYLSISYNQIKHFSYGQIITASLVGVTTFLLSWIFAIPNPGFLGLLAGITDFVPYLGVVITAIPMLILAFGSYGFWGIVTALIILTITNQLEMWIYAPRIAQEQVNINWFLILISMIIFGNLYSIVGVLITVPLLIMVRNLWEMFVIPYLRQS